MRDTMPHYWYPVKYCSSSCDVKEEVEAIKAFIVKFPTLTTADDCSVGNVLLLELLLHI